MILTGTSAGASAGSAKESGLRLDGFLVLLRMAPSRGLADRFGATIFGGSDSMMLMVEHKQKTRIKQRECQISIYVVLKGEAPQVAASDGHLVTGSERPPVFMPTEKNSCSITVSGYVASVLIRSDILLLSRISDHSLSLHTGLLS
jgi:hypothetical protein